jgi:hypothetical protein
MILWNFKALCMAGTRNTCTILMKISPNVDISVNRNSEHFNLIHWRIIELRAFKWAILGHFWLLWVDLENEGEVKMKNSRNKVESGLANLQNCIKKSSKCLRGHVGTLKSAYVANVGTVPMARRCLIPTLVKTVHSPMYPWRV